MNHAFQTHLPDRELIEATRRSAGAERQSTSTLLALLGEFDARRLYLGEGCSSLFTYCTQVLHLSEHAAYHRIEGARAARQFPAVLEMLADGAVTLTTVALLRPHLTPDNHAALLAAARHKSKRDVEEQIARLAPRSDASPLVRRIPEPRATSAAVVSASSAMLELGPNQAREPEETVAPRPPASAPVRTVVAALAPARYLLKMTVSGETHAKLRRAQDLLRHTIPSGDPAAVLDRALTLLVDQLERTKIAKTTRSGPSRRQSPRPSQSGSRHIPACMKREVWARDRGRCAFEGPSGRCTETGWLEFHHVVPFASGGPTTVENLALRCRAHNGFEAQRRFGSRHQQAMTRGVNPPT